MKTFLRIMLTGIVIAASTTLAPGQETSGQTSAEALRAQLSDVQAKEAELQARERQLDEDLRPENIERAIIGVGTTRPEELREQRRRQLEGEKARVRTQLDQLAQSRTRLEAAIATADAEAYRRSALVNDSNSPSQTTVTQSQALPKASAPKKQRRAVRRRRTRRRS
jgi:uncharacterized protein YlxW (UPF0749 family)